MRKIILIFFYLFISNTGFTQKQNTEIGFRLVNVMNFIESNGWGDGYFRTSIKSSLLYQQEVTTGMYGNFYKIEHVKTKGLYIPGIFIRQRVFKNLWVRGSAEIYFQRSMSDKPFSMQMGTSGTSYSHYDITKKGINIDYSLQYQWLNRKNLMVYTGLESQLIWQRRIDKSNGYTSGCFGGASLNPQTKNYFHLYSIPFITNSISYRIYKNLFVGYEIANTITNPSLIHRISISKKI